LKKIDDGNQTEDETVRLRSATRANRTGKNNESGRDREKDRAQAQGRSRVRQAIVHLNQEDPDAMTAYILMVTWFYFGQAPASYQTEFTSEELREGARYNLLHEEIRLRQVEEQSKQDLAHGIIKGEAPPPSYL
jgi:hypothetical protein